MKDNELRGLILERLYDLRDKNHGEVYIPSELDMDNIEFDTIERISQQLIDKGYAEGEFYPGVCIGVLRITAEGVGIIENTSESSIAIHLTQHIDDHSIHASGPANVQVVTGDTQGNASVSRSEGSLLAKVIGWFKSLLTGV